METLTEKLRHDPHIGKPIPGQSLTATPGSMPYENPPQVSSVETAYGILKAGLYQPKTQRELGQVTRAGISCETLASSMVMMAFSQGMFNPDVAEIIKPFLAFEIFKIAKNQGVDQVILENKPIQQSLDTDALEDLQNEAMPDNRYDVQFSDEEKENILNQFNTDEEEEIPQEGFISRSREVE